MFCIAMKGFWYGPLEDFNACKEKKLSFFLLFGIVKHIPF
jgi:hypothetical protein